MITEDKVIEIFCLADDFRKFFDTLFPHPVSYNRFVELEREVAILIKKALLGKCTGISLVDSTPLRVCRNPCILMHKVFKGIAAYCLFPKKLTINIERSIDNQLILF